MPILINEEAIKQLKSPLDIEKFGKRYKTSSEYFTFPDPNLKTIEDNLFYLLKHSEEIPFELQYKYRPDYLSYDYYGTTILDKMLMYINNVFSAEDFNLSTVVVPSLDAITFILQDTYAIPEPEDLTEIDW